MISRKKKREKKTFFFPTYNKHVNSSWISSHLVLGEKKNTINKNIFYLIFHCSLAVSFPGDEAKQIKIKLR